MVAGPALYQVKLALARATRQGVPLALKRRVTLRTEADSAVGTDERFLDGQW